MFLHFECNNRNNYRTGEKLIGTFIKENHSFRLIKYGIIDKKV